MRTFAIGDIHGCAKELNAIWKYLLEKENFNVFSDKIVFLGDYVDRGPNSKEVIDLCIDIKKMVPHSHFLKGNHEDMFMSFLGLGGLYGESYIMNGGNTTFLSYDKGLYGKYLHTGKLDSYLRTLIPLDHIIFLKELELFHETDKFIFVHAGADPDYDWNKQRVSDLMWQRDYFYSRLPMEDNHKKFGYKTFVHGHTPDGIHFDLPFRINIDSGCVFGGKLTCIEINEEKPINSRVFQVEADTEKVIQRF